MNSLDLRTGLVQKEVFVYIVWRKSTKKLDLYLISIHIVLRERKNTKPCYRYRNLHRGVKLSYPSPFMVVIMTLVSAQNSLMTDMTLGTCKIRIILICCLWIYQSGRLLRAHFKLVESQVQNLLVQTNFYCYSRGIRGVWSQPVDTAADITKLGRHECVTFGGSLHLEVLFSLYSRTTLNWRLHIPHQLDK